nr:thioredoxin [uncultured Eubacterium sp.]
MAMTVEVTAQNFDEEVLNYKGKVLVDFWAEWCGPCMMLGPVIEEVSEEVDDVKFCKVNCDEARDLALQFGIMTIPNLIVFENGEQVIQSIGYIEKEDVLELIK